jgi:steroid delta-isomerase-like uncharacterized protein
MRIGVLHPGNMGAALAAEVDGEVLWSSDGRSTETAERAKRAGITDAGTLPALVGSADLIISVCPPAAAEDVATDVTELGFDGLFVDANAVSPATARRVGGLFRRFVDGGIIGPPPTHGVMGETRLYLSGPEAATVAELFAGSSVDARVIGAEPGRASALKMAFAAWTKGSSALLLGIAALATAEGVTRDLLDEWEMSLPETSTHGLPDSTARKPASRWRRSWICCWGGGLNGDPGVTSRGHGMTEATSESNKAAAIRLYEAAFTHRNVDLADELLAPDVVFHSAGTEIRGRDGWKAFVGEWLEGFPDARLNVDFAMAEGDRVLLHWRAEGTHTGDFRGTPATGRTVSASGLNLFRLSSGQIEEIWDQPAAFGDLQALTVT